jgi:hypothetical protein
MGGPGQLALGPGGPASTDPFAASADPNATRYDANPTRFDMTQDPYATRMDGYGGGAEPNATRVDGYSPQSPGGALIGQLRQTTTGEWSGATQLYRKPPQQRQRNLLIAGGAAILVIAIAGFFLISKHSGGTSAAGTNSTSSTKPSTGTSSAAEQHAATALAALLAQSVTDRGDVIDADINVEKCGSKLAHDQEVFTKAAGNRDRLLGDLAAMSGRSALSAAMLQDLTGAWQASATVDSDLAKWAGVALAGCKPKTISSNAYLSASYGPDGQATQDKQAFASLWNPIANKYDLTNYESSQL